MWIELRKNQYPTEKGNYKCLVTVDDEGSLEEMDNQYFNGFDWCHMNSCRQFISYWWKENVKINEKN
jgi:hypothetical protein